MRDYLFIASGAGLRDALNPCIFMTASVFIVQARWLLLSPLLANCLRIIFGLVYAVITLLLDFGPFQVYVLHKNFVLTSKIIYFILGILAFVSGVLFFKDWLLSRRLVSVEDLTGKKIKLFWGGVVGLCLVTIILAVALSALANLWPFDRYILILGNMALIRGQWQTILLPLISYVLISMWPLWFVWAFLSIKNLRTSMFKIVCASIFFTASSCMIFIFK